MTRFYAFINSFIVSARDSERGQTMAEYAIVLSVITIAIIVTLGVLAGGISKTLNSVTKNL
jgi:Flp pilus assembly pilin Flp